MFDKFLVKIAQPKDVVYDPAYRPTRAITGKLLLHPQRKKLAVLFPPWHGGGRFYRRLISRLSGSGWAVLAYDFNGEIIEAQDKYVVKSFRQIQKKIVKDLKNLQTRNYQEIKLIGISLGNVPLTMVADKFRKFTSATMVVSGDDLAKDLWHSRRSTDIKQAFKKEHIGLHKLAKEWKFLAPKKHLKNFKGKKVKFIMSSHDKLINPKDEKSLAEAIKNAGADIHVRGSHFGHVLTSIMFCLFGRVD